MDDSITTDEGRAMEFEVLLAIYEEELRILAKDEQNTLSYEIDLKDIDAVLTLTLSDEYPKTAPTISVQKCGKHLDDLEGFLKTISDNLCGEVMIHRLIEEANKWARDSEYFRESQDLGSKKDQASSATVCKFFLEGRCRFGDRCLNSHQLTGKEVDNVQNPEYKDTKKEKNVREFETSKEEVQVKKSIHSAHDKEGRTTKKAPMKTATDVISRILWDEKIDAKDFTIGYLDRFIGIIEREFADFSWEDIASVDYDVLSIPKHRIQYFKYCGDIVWDKRERIDKIFGSTGSGCTILEVIGNESKKEERYGQSKVKDDKELKDEQEHYLDVACGKDRSSVSNKKSPNYFIAFKVQDAGILKEVDKLHVRKEDMSEGIIPLQKLHVTLLMLTIQNDAELNLVKDILKGIHHILPSTLPPSRKLKFKGIGSFHDRVLYVSVEKEPNLENFVKILKQKFHKAGINLNGNRDVYVPHMSIMRSPSTSREVFSNFESTYQDVEFGNQSIDEIGLFSRFDPKDQDDFYRTVLTMKNSLLSVLPTLQKKVMKHTEGLYDAEKIGVELKQKINASFDTQCPLEIDEALSLLEVASCDAVPKDSSKLVVILRGIPGCGKTYLIENSLENTEIPGLTVCSPKQLFYRAGNLKIDQSELNVAEAYCRNGFLEALNGRASLVVVDDCHAQTWQYAFYRKVAKIFGVPVRVLEINCNDRDAILECLKHGQSGATMEELLEIVRDWEEDPEALRIEPWFRNPTFQGEEGIDLRELLEST